MKKSLSVVILIAVCGVSACSKPPEDPKSPEVTNTSIGSAFAQREALRKSLEGTTWLWGEQNVPVTFAAEGKVVNEGWDSSGLVTRWEPIDRRTILLVVDKGRDNDRYAVLTFTEDLAEYDGYDFQHVARLPRNHKK